MKVQIRRNVFETNSSSTHSLTIEVIDKGIDIRKITGDSVTVGKTPESDMEYLLYKNDIVIDGKPDAGVDWQKRLDIFWCYCISEIRERCCDNPTVECSRVKSIIDKAFSSYGISVSFDENLGKIEGYSNICEDDNPFENIIDCSNEEEQARMLISYLFGNVLYYDFCDECGQSCYDAFTNKVNECRKKFAGKKGWIREERY